ncbi:hypothetical protein Kisp01_45320 [Kineosporia sp. NBRC 101677]|uniref:DUF3159 domain-containing protein n=1 Tax=Kineosporia sp. NBRC 101677 TaxID=3032197 RepID=UPI0024A20798|nr:DUF3159 domain-containing protein [Kineosporia sp. NBRC 101677]GLY17518.1 hypothetical protein Kisp01_45320 [Kineosporia sp. NBRC 101677]
MTEQQHGSAPVPGEHSQHPHPPVEHAAENVAERVGKGSFAQAVAAEFDLNKAIGGPRGVIESVLPYTVFSIAFAITQELRPSVYAALAPLVVLIAIRLVRREPLTQALSGVIGIAIGAWIASKTGRASDMFLTSIVKNGGSALGAMISIAVRWPVVGVFVGPITGEMFEWRHHRPRYQAFVKATWIFVALFLIRVAVQVPLSIADQATLLGLLNGLVLGLPLFAVALWLIWRVLRKVPPVTADHTPHKVS